MPPSTTGRRARPDHAALVRGGLAAIAVALLTGSAMLPAQQPANPSDVGKGTANEGRQVSLHDQLRVGLKAYTPKDKAFLDRVVLLVDQGVLPRNLVDSTFLWARNHAVARKGRNPLRPIVYFEPALVLRARRLGISL
jgi:hypothetical protein